MIYIGDGGELQPALDATGFVTGDLPQRQGRWSPDGRWFAYQRQVRGAVNLWLSRTNTADERQITSSAGNVLDFEWKPDGSGLFFSSGPSRAEHSADELTRARNGYSYDEDLYQFTDFMSPRRFFSSSRTSEDKFVSLPTRAERILQPDEIGSYRRAQDAHRAGEEAAEAFVQDAGPPAIVNSQGQKAWLARLAPASRQLQLTYADAVGEATVCPAIECTGVIRKIWWSEDGQRVWIWRNEGINDAAHAFYAWSPPSQAVSTVLRVPETDFRICDLAQTDQLVCVVESVSRPAHILALSLRLGATRELADLNPEFMNIGLGAVERIEWDTPRFAWNAPGAKLHGLYPGRAYGYIVYPPDFDPSKKYPLFVEPYVASGFNSSVGGEHALHAYAAQNIVVLNTAFPVARDAMAVLGADMMKQLYAADTGFPHLTMLMESTVRALSIVSKRQYIDDKRVGIGGVSHGTFVPLYMLQKYDLISAISISSPSWGPHEYYWGTRRIRESLRAAYGAAGYNEWRPKPTGAGLSYWNQIDIAEHVAEVEAPILLNLAADEAYAHIRFIRHLADAGKPYDAYVFPCETHIKWQPAHLLAIMNRNLDWFRFWLQDYQDPVPNKREQYRRWQQLKDLRNGIPVSLNAR